ncbi:gustatory receptor 47b [Musca autumnalis]|uniref:gustatory receptor 47b n=1 Tax=Musca autumnalis TaxID=221902 RepID=UPI003CE8A2DD
MEKSKIPIKTKNLLQCFKLMFFFLYHTGCLSFRLQSGGDLHYTQWSSFYVIIVRFVLLGCFCGGMTIKITTEQFYNAMIGRLSPIVVFIMCLESVVSVLCYLVVTFSLDTTRKEHLICWNRLQNLDDQVVKDFPNVNWNYHKNSRKYTRLTAAIYSYFSIISFGFVFNLANCRCGYLSSFLISFSYACITGSPGLAGFLFVVQMDMLRLRFRLLRKVFLLNFVANSGRIRRQSDIKILRKFKLLEYYFKEYSALIPRFNAVFNVVSSASMFYDFAILTNMGFLLCSKAIESNTHWKEYLFVAFFMLPRIYKVVVCSIYGHMAHAERKNVWQEFVHMESYFNKSLIVRDNMESLFHWRMHNNDYFTVGKTMRFNLGLMFMIFNSIANYIIILIQLQFQQNIITETLNSGSSKDVEMIEI